MNSKAEKKTGIVPRLRFSEFRDAGPWEVKRLGEVAKVINERAGDNEYNLLSVTAGVGLVSQVEKFGREIAGKQRKNYYAIKKNDFAYNKSATKDYQQGYIGLYTGEEPAAVPNSIFVCFRPNVRKVVPRYLDLLFAANFHGKWLARSITVGARTHGSLNIDNRDLLDTPLPVPLGDTSLVEQQKIADCLSSLDEVIALEAQKLEALKAHKKGLMQQLFPREGETTPRLRFPEFRDAGPWEVKRLGEVLSLEYGAPLPEAQRANGLVPVVGSNGIVGFHDQALVDGPAIVIGRKGSAGQVNWIDTPCYPIDTTFYVAMTGTDCKLLFLKLLLERHQLPNIVSEGGVPGLNRNDVYAIKSAIPSFPEQQKIADCLSSLDEVIALEAQKLEALKAHKKGLLQQLFPQEVA